MCDTLAFPVCAHQFMAQTDHNPQTPIFPAYGGSLHRILPASLSVQVCRTKLYLSRCSAHQHVLGLSVAPNVQGVHIAQTTADEPSTEINEGFRSAPIPHTDPEQTARGSSAPPSSSISGQALCLVSALATRPPRCWANQHAHGVGQLLRAVAHAMDWPHAHLQPRTLDVRAFECAALQGRVHATAVRSPRGRRAAGPTSTRTASVNYCGP
jgi:hypothetical protein